MTDPNPTTTTANPGAPTPRATVLIPVKGHETLGPCLDSLGKQDGREPFEVIVIDGWYDDRVVEVCERYDFVRVIRSRDNLLQCIGRNLGADEARGEYLVFLDADCVAEPTYVSAAVRALDDGARMVGGPVLNAKPWNVFAVSDNFSQFADFPVGRPDGRAEYFPGCNMALRKEDFDAVGRFPDTKMPAGEDTMLCFAVEALHPGGLRFVNQMRMKHIGRDTWSGFLKHQSFFGYCRASCGLKMTMRQRALGRSRWFALPLVAKRMLYMLQRTVQWHPAGLLRVAVISPVVFIGMFVWAGGFRRGCLEPIQPYSCLYGEETAG